MTDQWDFYVLHLDNAPASLFVDFGIEDEAPRLDLAHLAMLRLTMNQPREDGLSSAEEFDRLCALEDELNAEVAAADIGFVGRITTRGYRDFHYYVADPAAWEARVAQVMARHPDYRYRTGTREDPQWATYFNDLLPGPEDRQRLENRQVCSRLEALGDALTAPRLLDHFAYFEDEASAQAFITEAVQQGFTCVEGPVRTSDEDPFSVQLARVDVPGFDTIDELTLPLWEAARRHGGDYDGWGCEVQEAPAEGPGQAR